MHKVIQLWSHGSVWLGPTDPSTKYCNPTHPKRKTTSSSSYTLKYHNSDNKHKIRPSYFQAHRKIEKFSTAVWTSDGFQQPSCRRSRQDIGECVPVHRVQPGAAERRSSPPPPILLPLSAAPPPRLLSLDLLLLPPAHQPLFYLFFFFFVFLWFWCFLFGRRRPALRLN